MRAMSGIGVPANDPMVVPHGDGTVRCRWATETQPDLVDYHDRQWGTPVHEERGLLEALAMTYFENGLSFAVVFGKREALRWAFHGFEPAEVAAFTRREIEALMLDRTIVRNRAKIEATVHNAQVMQSVSLDELVWRHRPRRHRLRKRTDGRVHSPESRELAKTLRKAGFRLVGPAVAHSFMQAVGVENGHFEGCFRAQPEVPIEWFDGRVN
ncbi:DNA-3-methyladenine glycosylase I [Mycobacterium sp. URHB0021]